MTNDEAIHHLARMAAFFEVQKADSWNEVEIILSTKTRDQIVSNLHAIMLLLEPPPPASNCNVKHHAPGCRCGDL